MDYENMIVAELKALMRECGLRGYSPLRKAEYSMEGPMSRDHQDLVGALGPLLHRGLLYHLLNQSGLDQID